MNLTVAQSTRKTCLGEQPVGLWFQNRQVAVNKTFNLSQ